MSDKKKPAKKPKAKKINWKDAAMKLASCVITTLQVDGKFGGGSGMTINLKTREVKRWQEPFFDALEAAGIVYDREAYFAQKPSRNRARG